jgi:hypothetical protein
MMDPTLLDSDEIATEITDDLRGRVKSELDPGERLLWVGRPEAARVHPFVEWGMWITGVLLVPCVMFAGVFPPSLIFVVYCGLAFVAFSLNRWMERRRLAETLYALTDRRAIIWEPWTLKQGAFRVQTLSRGEVASLSRIEYEDGSGDIHFRVKGIDFARGVQVGPTRFRGIVGVRGVENLVRRTLMDHEGSAE